jgi:hypothetical protein
VVVRVGRVLGRHTLVALDLIHLQLEVSCTTVEQSVHHGRAKNPHTLVP